MEIVCQQDDRMIDRKELRKLHKVELPLHILEQDYIQALFLTELYATSENIVFKGGTFLKHAYGLDRFSEDMDFTARDDKFRDSLQKASEGLKDYGIENILIEDKDTKNSYKGKLVYKGPLYTGEEKTKGRVEIEISKREDIFLSPEWIRLFFVYPETRVVNCLGLQEREVFSEKLRALSSRSKARDLYDVWFLMQQGLEPDLELFEKKMKVIGDETAVRIDTTAEEWSQDLQILLENPPAFSKVRTEVIKNLNEKGFNVVEI